MDIPKPKRVKDTRKGDRHRPGYWAEYMRNRRSKLKALRQYLEAQGEMK